MEIYRAFCNEKPLSDNAKKNLFNYFKKNYSMGYIVSIGDFFFDLNSLGYMINDGTMCTNCLSYQPHHCCEGNSYSMQKNNYDNVLGITEKAVSIIEEETNSFSITGYKTFFTKNKATKAFNGNCIFYYMKKLKRFCALREVCKRENLKPEEHMPFLCNLFPIEGVILPNGKIFIFCSGNETLNFSMYHYTQVDKVCLNYEFMVNAYIGNKTNKYLRSVSRNDIIAKDFIKDFKPSYVVRKDILIVLVGSVVYEELCSTFNNYKKSGLL